MGPEGHSHESVPATEPAEQAPPEKPPPATRRRRLLRVLVAVIGVSSVAGVLLIFTGSPHETVHETFKPPEREVAAQTVPLTAVEQKALRLLIDHQNVALSRIAARAQGDIDQTADTAGTVRANGVLGEVAQPPGTRQNIARRRVTARLESAIRSSVQLLVITRGSAQVDSDLEIRDARKIVLQRVHVTFSSSGTALQYVVLHLLPTSSTATLSLTSASTDPFFWSLSRL